MRSPGSRMCSGICHDGYDTRLNMALIQAFGEMISVWQSQGWNGHLVTMMFDEIPGNRTTKVRQMQQAVYKLYGRLLTRMFRNPRSAKWAALLPRGVFSPDLPVSKRNKQDLFEVAVNEGAHIHGALLTNTMGRIREPSLDEHFRRNRTDYLISPLREIHVLPIVSKPADVLEYTLKQVKRRSFTFDDLTIVPRLESELPDEKLWRDRFRQHKQSA
jgi:hypothetical protein